MKHYIISVSDRAVGAYGRIFQVPSPGYAVRNFTDEVNRKAQDNPMNQHPEDFELHLLGEFEDTTGKMDNLAQPQVLARAKDVLYTKEQ